MSLVIRIEIPLESYQQLAEAAQYSGHETIADMLLGIALRMTGIPEQSTLEVLHRQGLPDADIARQLNVTNRHVSDRRRKLGLPANPRPGSGW